MRKTRRRHNVTPIAKKRDRADIYYTLKLHIKDQNKSFDLLVVPHRDMILNIINEGIGSFIGTIDGLDSNCPLLDENKEAGKVLELEDVWSNDIGSYTIGKIYWVDEESAN